VAATKISGEEDRYSHTDLYDFQGNIDGAKKIVDLFRPQIEKQDAAFIAKVDKNFATVTRSRQVQNRGRWFRDLRQGEGQRPQGAGRAGQYVGGRICRRCVANWV
jgi:hypothetical protein